MGAAARAGAAACVGNLMQQRRGGVRRRMGWARAPPAGQTKWAAAVVAAGPLLGRERGGLGHHSCDE
jgi:hypothetical protein